MNENNEITKSIAEEIESEVKNEMRKKLTEETINGETVPEESTELTEEEKRKQFIKALKDSKKTYKPKKHFGVAYKKDRKRKNKQAKASRRANRR